jgi:hypothetical protein
MLQNSFLHLASEGTGHGKKIDVIATRYQHPNYSSAIRLLDEHNF